MRNGKNILPPLPGNLDINSNSFSPDFDIDSLSEGGKQLIELVMHKMDEMKGEIIAKIDEKNSEIERLENRVVQLTDEVSDLRGRLEDVESRQRGDSLILSGNSLPAVREGESCGGLVSEIFKNQLKHVLLPGDIVESYRLGKKPASQTPDRRPILVKFNKREIKDTVLMNCKSVKPTNLYINENLTPMRAKILSLLRRLKREKPQRLAAVGSRDGRVYAWLKPPNPSAPNSKVFFNTLANVEKFCGDLEVNFNEFVGSNSRN